MKQLILGILLTISMSVKAADSFETVRASFQPSYWRLLDRHGQLLQKKRWDFHGLKEDWLPLSEVSPVLIDTLLLAEDKQFYAHHGVDLEAIIASLWNNLSGRPVRGGSTISMQLAALLNERIRTASGRKTIPQKIFQIWSAAAIEQSWTKSQILEAYLNLASFRGELVGIHAFARQVFGKSPLYLNRAEAAIAVALLRAPNASGQKVLQRACQILTLSANRPSPLSVNSASPSAITWWDRWTFVWSAIKNKLSLLFERIGSGTVLSKRLIGQHDDPCQALSFYNEQLNFTSNSAERMPAQEALHYANFVQKQLLNADKRLDGRSFDVYSTLNQQIQLFVENVLKRQLLALHTRNVQDGAVIVMDNKTGDILAWVGSSGSISKTPHVDHVLAQRQAGSTLKPFLYQLGIQGNWVTAASIVNDAPLTVASGNSFYIPQNYDKQFKGPVSVRTALASSLNIPAVRLAQMVGPEKLRERLYELGLHTINRAPEFYNHSLALGSADVRLLDLTNAYRCLANRGICGSNQFWLSIRAGDLKDLPQSQSKIFFRLDPASTFIISNILSDRVARSLTFGLENAFATRFWSAVKSGTSKDMRDNWAIGYSQWYTVGVWVGNSDGSPMWDVSGVHGAAPIWNEVITFLHKEFPQSALPPEPVKPPSVVKVNIQYVPKIEADREEFFVAGTEQTTISLSEEASRLGKPRIVHPVDASVYALDPDIPRNNQKIVFSASRPTFDQETVRWQLNGVVVGQGAQYVWLPMPGKHRMVLLNAKGQVFDQIVIHVK